jgi:hypothetical protein
MQSSTTFFTSLEINTEPETPPSPIMYFYDPECNDDPEVPVLLAPVSVWCDPVVFRPPRSIYRTLPWPKRIHDDEEQPVVPPQKNPSPPTKKRRIEIP